MEFREDESICSRRLHVKQSITISLYGTSSIARSVFHGTVRSERLYVLNHVCDVRLLFLQLVSSNPHFSVQFIAAKCDQRNSHLSPRTGVLRRRPMCHDLRVVEVRGHLGRIITRSNDRIRALCLCCADVQDAKIHPDQAPDMHLYGVVAPLFAIALESVLLRNPDCSSNEG